MAFTCPSLVKKMGTSRPAIDNAVPERVRGSGTLGAGNVDVASLLPNKLTKLPGASCGTKLAPLRTAPSEITGGSGFTCSAPPNTAVPVNFWSLEGARIVIATLAPALRPAQVPAQRP